MMKHPVQLFLALAVFLLALTLNSTEKEPASLKSGCEYDYPPFCIVDNKGKATGFSVELMEAALRVMNRQVDFQTGPWLEVKALLEEGQVDALPLVGRTPEREELFDFTFPYLSLHGAIVVQQGRSDIQNLEDLVGQKVAVMAGDNAEEFLKRSKLKADITATATFEVALRGLAAGDFDAVIIQRLLALRLIQERQIPNLKIVKNPLEELRQDFCFAVKEGDNRTLALLNEGLALVVADGTLAKLQKKWFSPLELPDKQKILIGTESGFPPYSFRDEEGRPIGFNIDLIEALADMLDLEIEIRIGSWGDIREALDHGDIDGIVGMYSSEERERNYDFSPPFAIVHHAIFARQDSPQLREADDLKDKDLIVMSGDIMHDYVLENKLTSHLVPTASIPEALQLLASGEHDFALTAQYSSLHWINQLDLNNLNRVGPLLRPSEYCLAVAEGNHRLLYMLNEGLSTLQQTGQLKAINDKWLGNFAQADFPLKQIIKYVAMVIVPLLLVLIAALVWSRTLQQKVEEKTLELKKSRQILAESEQKFRLLADHTHDWEYWMDPKGNYLYISPSCERITGYRIGEFKDRPDLLFELVQGDYKTSVMAHYKDQHNLAEPFFNMTFPLKDRQGNLHWIEHYCSPVFDDQGKFAGRRGSNRDISERKKAEFELAESNNLRELLLDIITHDLRNPASAIFSFAEHSLSINPEDKILQGIYDSSEALIRTLENTTVLTQATFGESIPKEPLNIYEILERLTIEFSRELETAGMSVEIDIPRDLVLIVNPLVEEIFKNFISNALRYASTGASLSIDGKFTQESITIYVRDLGETIPEDKRETIFERRAQLASGSKRGRGLGLAIARRIAHAHGGEVGVEPNQPKGNSFWLRLPLKETDHI